MYLSEGSVDEVHGAHGAAGIVEDPLLDLVDVAGVVLVEGLHNVIDGLGSRGVVLGNGRLGHLLQHLGLEDVAVVHDAVQVVEGHQQHHQRERTLPGKAHLLIKIW